MCWVCKENGGEYILCRVCGVAVCYDAKPGDEYPEPAGATTEGTILCLEHATQQNEETEEDAFDAMDAYFDLYYGGLD